MNTIDLIVLFGTLLLITIFGVYKTRGTKNIDGYFRGNNTMPWWTIGLSVMATQASAITFLSTPGQAFEDGMRFVQFYFGLPIAMVIISITVIPIFYRLKVFTAYEYLEGRFDLKTRTLAAFLFLVQRGLAAGITIYAPAIVLSTILGWSLTFNIMIIGVLVIIYTVSGGTKAVSQTQKYQMAVMMGGMAVAGYMVFYNLPPDVTFTDALNVAGKMGKLNAVDFSFDINNRYNFWSGITGGLFLAMSYFGTDQSQVQRYIAGRSIGQSRLGLIFNGLLKVPMQFLILFIGILVFIFYQFNQPPVFFNSVQTEKIQQSEYSGEFNELQEAYSQNFEEKQAHVRALIDAQKNGNEGEVEVVQEKLNAAQQEADDIEKKVADLIKKNDPEAETTDTDYVFITFVMNYLPPGLVGLLLAVIFSAAMSSTSSELNALASTTTVDLYKRSVNDNGSQRHYLVVSKLFTIFWGIMAISFAAFASLVDNLIQAVNILGSIFYGTILGVFLTAFYLKYIKAHAVFIAALIAESVVILMYFFSGIGFLWFNVIGCVLVIIVAYLLQFLFKIRQA